MNRSSRWLASLPAALILASCASDEGRWENPSVSQKVWELHTAECRRLASERAEQEFALATPDIGATFGRQTTYRDTMSRFEAARRREQLFDRCMRDRGYHRAKPAPEAEGAAED